MPGCGDGGDSGICTPWALNDGDDTPFGAFQAKFDSDMAVSTEINKSTSKSISIAVISGNPIAIADGLTRD
jgi:hypothetical protein